VSAPDPERPRVPWFSAIVRLALGIGLFAAVIAWLLGDAGSIEIEPHLGMALVGLAAAAVANAVTARRWQLLAESMSASRLPYGVYFHHLAATRVIGQFLPLLFVDLVGRSASLRAAGSRAAYGRLLAPLVLERLLDLILPAVLLVWVLATFDASPTVAWASLAIVVAVFALASVPLLRPTAALGLAAWAWARRRLGRPTPAEDPPAIDRALAARVTGWSLARFTAIGAHYWASGAALGVTLPALVLLGAMPLSQLAALVGITPGALGIQETGWTAALRQLGVASADIVVFVIATRAAMIVNFSVLALASWPWRGDHSSRAR
jgi:uncharacterized membrane protein YbhN (UPF0104 family)